MQGPNKTEDRRLVSVIRGRNVYANLVRGNKETEFSIYDSSEEVVNAIENGLEVYVDT